jgi:hypothetical protein
LKSSWVKEFLQLFFTLKVFFTNLQKFDLEAPFSFGITKISKASEYAGSYLSKEKISWLIPELEGNLMIPTLKRALRTNLFWSGRKTARAKFKSAETNLTTTAIPGITGSFYCGASGNRGGRRNQGWFWRSFLKSWSGFQRNFRKWSFHFIAGGKTQNNES